MTNTKLINKTLKENIKKARIKWASIDQEEQSQSQPKEKRKVKPGIGGGGEYFRIIVRPKDEFITFRYHDVGDPGHIQRLTGKRTSGSWDTQAWLIAKSDAHVEKDSLIADTSEAKEILEMLGSIPEHIKADLWEAHDRPNIPEDGKPTKAQKTAQMKNIKKVQMTRRKN